MLYWINFLHIYQPPTQESHILKKVALESYAFILDLLAKYPQVKITMNISGSLLEKLEEYGLNQVIDGFKENVVKGRIEIVGSAMYHPILPLIPEEEISRQINLHNKKLKEVFGVDYRPKGFYLPEMAYSKKVADIIKEAGFEWIILDEIHLDGEKPKSEVKYKIENKNNGLTVLFRNRKYSKSFPPKSIIATFKDLQEKYLITAHDGEMYGHWHKDNEGDIGKIFSNKEVENITVSEYLKNLKETEIVKLRDANWESSKEELKNNIPYALWDSPKNKIQKKLWQFEKWVYNVLLENKNDSNFQAAKKHFDRGIASCFWWWASERKIDVFSPLSWNPTEIEKGADELIKAVRSLEDLDSVNKRKAEKLLSQLVNLVWQNHWKKYSKKRKNNESR